MSTSIYFRRVSSRVVEQLFATPERVRTVLFPSSSETVIDDDVLVTISEGYEHVGNALEPNNFLANGGTPIGSEVIGDAPARGFSSANVRTLASKVTVVSVDDIKQTLRETQLPPTAPPITELVESYRTLREFVIETAKAEAGMIVYVG